MPEEVDAGYPLSDGTAASDELFRIDLAQLPDMDCGCGATIVVGWLGVSLEAAILADKSDLSDPGDWKDLGAIDAGCVVAERLAVPAQDDCVDAGGSCDRLSDESPE